MQKHTCMHYQEYYKQIFVKLIKINSHSVEVKVCKLKSQWTHHHSIAQKCQNLTMLGVYNDEDDGCTTGSIREGM